MEAYKQKLKRRVVWLAVGTLAAIAAVATANFLSDNTLETSVPDFWRGYVVGFPLGLLVAYVLLMVVEMVRIRRALNNEAKLKAMYTEETDERRRMIREKVGQTGFSFMLELLFVAGIVAIYFSITVSLTLFAVLVVMALVMIVLKAYYRAKY